MMRLARRIVLIELAVVVVLSAAMFLLAVPSLSVFTPGSTALMTFRARQNRDLELRREFVPLGRISPHLAQAVIASEDARFYEHRGVDWKELRAAFAHNLEKESAARGASTLTMQLAKNLYLSPDRNVARKALEILMALEMDALLGKTRVLELYLNAAEWGEGVFGAEAAARHYFKKSAFALAPDEAAFLAAILPNPLGWGHWPPGPYVRSRMATIRARMGAVPGP